MRLKNHSTFAILLIPILFAARFFIYSNLENSPEFSNLTTQTLNTFQAYGTPPKDQTTPLPSNTATAQISFSILPDLEPPLPPTIQKIGAPLDKYTYNITLLSEYDADIFINNVYSGKVKNINGTFDIALHLEPGDNLFQFSAKDFSLNRSSISEIILRLSPDEHTQNEFTIIQIPVAKPTPVYYPIDTISPIISSTTDSGGGSSGGGSGSPINTTAPQIVVQTLQIHSTPTYPPNFQNPDGTYIPEGSHYLPIPTYLPVSLYLSPGTYLPGGAYTPNGISYIYPETVLPFFSYLPIGTYLPGGAYLPTSPYEAQSQNIPSWVDSKMIFAIGENSPFIGNILLVPSKFMTLKNDGILQYYTTLPLSTSNSTFMSNYNFVNPFLGQVKSPNMIDSQPTVETEVKSDEEIKPSEEIKEAEEILEEEAESIEEPTETEIETVMLSEEISSPAIEVEVVEVIGSKDVEDFIKQIISSEIHDTPSMEIRVKNDFIYNATNILKNTLVLTESFKLSADLLLIEPTKIHEPLTLPAPIILSDELTLQDDLVLPEDMILPKEGIKLPKNTTLKRLEGFFHALLYANLTLPRFENPNDIIVLSRGTIIPKGTILPPRTELPKGTVLPANTILPKGTVLPKRTILPPKTILAKGTTIYLKNTAPKGVELITNNIPRPNDTKQRPVPSSKHPEIPLPPPAEIAQGIRSPGEFIKLPIAGLFYNTAKCNNNWISCRINWLSISVILFMLSTGVMLYKAKIFKKISKFTSRSH